MMKLQHISPTGFCPALGLTASGTRVITPMPRSLYNLYNNNNQNTNPDLGAATSAKQIVEHMLYVINNSLADTQQLAPTFKRSNTQQTLKAIWQFFFDHFQYKEDDADKPLVQRREILRRPTRARDERQTGIDCDCFSISICSILTHLQIKCLLKVVHTKDFADYNHVYVIVPKHAAADLSKRSNYWVIDPVLHQFDVEAPNIIKSFTTPMKVVYFNGLGTPVVVPGNAAQPVVLAKAADKAQLQVQLLQQVQQGKITAADAAAAYTTAISNQIPKALPASPAADKAAGLPDAGRVMVKFPRNHNFWWIKTDSLPEDKIDFINQFKTTVAHGAKWAKDPRNVYGSMGPYMGTFMDKWLQSFDGPVPYTWQGVQQVLDPQKGFKIYQAILDAANEEESRRQNAIAKGRGVFTKIGDALGDAANWTIGLAKDYIHLWLTVYMSPIRQLMRLALAVNVFDAARKIHKGTLSWAEAQKEGFTQSQYTINVNNTNQAIERWERLGGNKGDLLAAVGQGAAKGFIKLGTVDQALAGIFHMHFNGLGAAGADDAAVGAGVAAGATAVETYLVPVLLTSVGAAGAKIISSSADKATAKIDNTATGPAPVINTSTPVNISPGGPGASNVNLNTNNSGTVSTSNTSTNTSSYTSNTGTNTSSGGRSPGLPVPNTPADPGAEKSGGSGIGIAAVLLAIVGAGVYLSKSGHPLSGVDDDAKPGHQPEPLGKIKITKKPVAKSKVWRATV